MSALAAANVAQSSLPVIDIGGLGSSDNLKKAEVAARLRDACLRSGFFYVAGHGVPQALIDEAFACSRAFFDLPEIHKRQVDKVLSSCNRGYEPLRAQVLEADAPPDLKESFYIGEDLPPDDPRVTAGKFNHGPNQWPDQPAGFRPVMERYFDALQELSAVLMRGLALSLMLPEDYFDDFCRQPMATLRLLHYPPQPANPLPGEKGCGAHTDFGSLTLLAQDDAGGLQVWGEEQGWIHAPPLPGTFVVNLGDLVARWTNDRYRSTLHRVVNTSGRQRYSIPFFYTGNPDYVVSCLPTCLGPGETARYPAVTTEEHLAQCYRRTYA